MSEPAAAPVLWQTRILAHRETVDALEEIFDEALSVAKMRVNDQDQWTLEALFADEPQKAVLEAAIASKAQASGFREPKVEIAELEQRDWLAENQAALKIMNIGRFQIVPEHRLAEAAPSHRFRIVLDAGPAFGSGTHETTRSCLLLMEGLSRRFRPRSVLDVGTGSGILAIGAALLWNRPVMATDIDPIAIATALENAQRNQCSRWIGGAVGPGVEPVARGGPYDLVVANILAKPLAGLAQDLAKVTTPAGRLILSGILSTQENQVLEPYRNAGFRLAQRKTMGPWSSYLLRRV